MDNTQSKKFSATLDAWLENLSRTGRSRKQAVSIAVDSTIVLFSLWMAYSLRFGEPFSGFKATWHIFLFLPVFTVVMYMSLGIYRWVVRSSNNILFNQLIKAVIASAIFLALFSFIFPADRNNPRSLFIIYGLLLGTGTCGVRFLWRGIFHSGDRGEPVAIYGAGDAGRLLMSSLSQGTEYRPVLFLDDNPTLDGSTIAGIPVQSMHVGLLKNMLAGYEVERVILAMPSLGPVEYQEKVDLFEECELPVLTVPNIGELISGSAKVGQVRDISVSDILGRKEVPPNQALLGKCVAGKNILVTGGGGSIGSELSRQILLQRPNKLIIFDQSEFNLYQITEEINNLLSDYSEEPLTEYLPVLGTVNDVERVTELISNEQIHTVYHAAAYKHVPVIEAQPEQGLDTNVFGTLNVLNAAIAAKVENFVLISTDKAVRPTNSMGATKRIAELVLQAKAPMQHSTTISMVRFGNVLGSSGSVVPKFKQQIEQGGPITLTNPDVTRYFMTIREAAQLVLQASAIAKGGDVFVLDMGEAVRIEELAIAMVGLSGRRLKRHTGKDEDIDIVIEGLRPGEKMYEEMFLTDSHQSTVVAKVFTAEEAWIDWSALKVQLEQLKALRGVKSRVSLRAKLLRLSVLKIETENSSKLKINNYEADEELVDTTA